MFGLSKTLRQLVISSLMVSLTTSVAAAQSANRMPRPPRPRAKEGKVMAVRLKDLKVRAGGQVSRELQRHWSHYDRWPGGGQV
jgi:hypothetical protein